MKLPRLVLGVSSVMLFVSLACSGDKSCEDCASCANCEAAGEASCAGCDAGNGSGGGSAAGGSGAGGSASASGGNDNAGPVAACSNPEILIHEIDLGFAIDESEDEVNLRPLAIAPIPSGGARLAVMGKDGLAHVVDLDADDQPTGTSRSFAVHDMQDIFADDSGGVLLVTREAEGGGTLGCGNPDNLCIAPDTSVPCYDMHLLRFDGTAETWATKLTSSSASLPPYSTGKTGPDVFMIWWYAHHGRIASDGTNFAAYFGAAISVSQAGCINIHQGDRMKVVSPSGSITAGGFDWGCSHSGYERLLWDADASKYVAVCKTDNNNRLALAPNIKTIAPVDLAYSNMSDLARDTSGGYWVLSSDAQAGEPALAAGMAELSLLRFSDGVASETILIAGGDGENARAPYLAEYGQNMLITAWESSSAAGDLQRNDPNRKMWLQVRDRASGEAVSEAFSLDLQGNRYQAMRRFPDGSVAYAAPGSGPSQVKILRVAACEE